MITVIISEKDEFTRLGLKAALRATEEIKILGDYETDEMMLSDLSSLNPDVVILGHAMGLWHSTDDDDIMYYACCPTTEPTSNDEDAVNDMY